jgi:hypothetical protein
MSDAERMRYITGLLEWLAVELDRKNPVASAAITMALLAVAQPPLAVPR